MMYLTAFHAVILKSGQLLEEVGGMCLYRDNTIGGGKAVILVGEKSNGNSTFIFMLQSMLGGFQCVKP